MLKTADGLVSDTTIPRDNLKSTQTPQTFFLQEIVEVHKEAIKRGISKVNIFTDIDRAGKKGIEKGLAAGAQSLSALMPYMLDAMRAVTRNKIELFGSANRA